MNTSEIIGNEEDVARILHRDWVVDGKLQLMAFALNEGETYLSVNRLSIESFTIDVRDFINKHSSYRSATSSNVYRQAILNVGEIRSISVSLKDKIASLSVEVEPRDFHYKSHAGIFTRIDDKNIKGGQHGEMKTTDGQVLSYDDIHLKVYFSLLKIAKLEIVDNRHYDDK